jgi:hypothetical protein
MQLLIKTIRSFAAGSMTLILMVANWVVLFNAGGAERWIASILVEGYYALPVVRNKKSR